VCLRILSQKSRGSFPNRKFPKIPDIPRTQEPWVLRLKPEADIALQIAALGHDIERSIKELWMAFTRSPKFEGT